MEITKVKLITRQIILFPDHPGTIPCIAHVLTLEGITLKSWYNNYSHFTDVLETFGKFHNLLQVHIN